MTPVRLLTRTRPLRSPAVPATAALALLLLLPGCTADPDRPPAPRPPGAAAPPAFRLVAFDSCADALTGLKAAAKKVVGPYWGVPLSAAEGAVADRAAAPAGAGDQREKAPAFSGTNNHEAAADEPDLVKTDGRRIVTVNRGMLRVVDPASRRISGEVEVAAPDSPARYAEMSLLLHGDRALVLVPQTWAAYGRPGSVVDAPIHPGGVGSSQVLLVDLSGSPRVIGRYQTDAALVDARQVGSMARVVVRSQPRIDFPHDPTGTDAQRIAANRKAIDRTPLTDWLPRYQVTTGGRTETGNVPCERLVHPPEYSGMSMLSLLTFDLTAAALGSGDAVTVAADGDTVYGTATSLYVTSDPHWRSWPIPADRAQGSSAGPSRPAKPTTQIHRFDLTTPGRPRYVASGEVPGWLVNQYALSEWQGHLRVATTSGPPDMVDRHTSSAVYVLRVPDSAGESVQALREVGRVTGLGHNERIYAVRFLGDTGYVVTFRQTDPLYSLDLRDPAHPRVTGELKINGYSAYLHKVDDGRLIGIGQDADDAGRVKGTQVSLFDVSDPARPVRIAQHRIDGAYSEAEFDPHAFLYWPADRLLVVPLFAPEAMGTQALALRVGNRALDEVGRVGHPEPEKRRAEKNMMIRRSLVVGDTLWTVSDAGLLASRVTDLREIGWVPLT
jgi:uncharacterized secreted protein with C-terminal beta-propeller domain